MKKGIILFILSGLALFCQSQVSISYTKTDNGFVRTRTIGTRCTIHNEGDSIIVQTDHFFLTGEDEVAFCNSLERLIYADAVAMLIDNFAYKIEEINPHYAILKKTIIETLEVERHNEQADAN